MNIGCQEFIDSLCSLSEGIQNKKLETLAYWEPDEPPITTLFAALGDQIAEDFDSVGLEINQRVFKLIEEAMTSADNCLMTAVATGLIEALVTRSARQDGQWPRMASIMGVASRRHAEAWLAG